MKDDLYDRLIKKIDNKVTDFPFYVQEFIQHKLGKSSPQTIHEYLYDYRTFFEWLVTKHSYQTFQEIPLLFLEKLRIKDITEFENYLRIRLRNSDLTVNRKLSSLKSLFHYLSQIAEDENLYPYLKRNVMAKVELASVRVSISKKAEKMESQILRTTDSKDEFADFIQFVAEGYPKIYEQQLTGDPKKDRGVNRMILFHRMNKERDVAILSLFLGSGLRISELVNLDIDDVNKLNRTLNVLRKGNKEDIVDFDEQALIDLEEYLEVRSERYGVASDFKPLFVPSKVGRKGSGRMTVRGVQKMLEKYVDAYQGPNLTAHKLRHSFATRLYENSKDIVLVKDQLGHESIETTNLYTHLSNTQRKRALEHMNRGGFIDE